MRLLPPVRTGKALTPPRCCREHNVFVTFERPWPDAVRAACEPVLDAADVGFLWNERITFDNESALLWEADPSRFAARHPDSGTEESYSNQWPPPCIDYWIYVDQVAMTARLAVEGWNVQEETYGLTGDGLLDGRALASRLAEILSVSGPADLY